MSSSLAPIALYVVLSVSLAVSLYTDLRSRLIYDVITFPTLIVALAIRLALVGWDGPLGLGSGLLGAAVALGVFLLPALLDGMGMGDVKLAGAIGAVLGWERIVSALLFIALAGGVFALVVMIRSGSLGRTLRNVCSLLLRPFAVRRRGGADEAGVLLPYGVAIVAGTACSLFLGDGGGW